MAYVSAEYDLLEPVSNSHDSVVYLARKKGDSSRYLIKVLADTHAGGGAYRELRFRREIDIVSSLDHPGIVRPIETIANDHACAVVYKYSQGQTLRQLMAREERVSAAEAADIAAQLLDALEYIHTRGIIHCDINPNNVLISPEKRVRLLDFGLALDKESPHHSRRNSFFGTLPYVSPEQIGAMDCSIDQRSDLYCVTLLLYELLKGELPFGPVTESVLDLANNALKTEPELIDGIPDSLNAVVCKGLKAAPGERYQTAAGLRHDLMRIVRSMHGEADIAVSEIGAMDRVAAIGDTRVFVSRDAEIDMLQRALERLEKRKRPAAYVIYGESGVGKTEVARELLGKALTKKGVTLSAKCSRFTPNQPYSVLRRLCLEFITALSSLDKKKRADCLKGINEKLADMSGVVCRAIPELRCLFEKVSDVEEVEREKEFDRVVHVMANTLETFCSFTPAVLFVDDMQWIDRASLEILLQLATNKARLFLLTTFRTDGREELYVHGRDLRSQKHLALMHITPFTVQEVEDLLAARFSDSKTIVALAPRLCAMTDGAAFTVDEAIRHLINSRIIYKQEGDWAVNEHEFNALPDKFDPVLLVLEKVDKLESDAKQYLQWCSLVEGGFEPGLIEKVGGFSDTHSNRIVKLLTSLGLIVPRFSAGYAFCHDRVQESIRKGIDVDARFGMYEQLGTVYEQGSGEQGEMLFNAAECFLKSKNIRQSISTCCRAAQFAASNIAFDVAIHYYQAALIMEKNCPFLGIDTPIDRSGMKKAFADVLALSGRQQQALNIFRELLDSSANITPEEILEVQYAIGSLYNNMGDFENAITHLSRAAKELGVRIPRKKVVIALALCIEIGKQIVFSLGGRRLIPKRNTSTKLLAVKVLNKLSYSLYFYDMIPCLFVHFRSLNYAETTLDCFEKAEAYATHIVPAFQLFLHKRSKIFYKKAVTIANKINRRDVLAYAHSFYGLSRFYAAEWNEAIKRLDESIRNYGQIGHFWDRIVPLENLGWVYKKKGNFAKSLACFEEEIELCKRCNDLRGLLNATSTREFLLCIRSRSKKSIDPALEQLSQEVDDSLVHTIVNKYIAKSCIVLGDYARAWVVLRECMQTAKEKSLNQEYVSSIYADYAELMARELLARENGAASIEMSNDECLRGMRTAAGKGLLIGVQYRAHLGAALRAFGWYYAQRNKKARARFFLLSAVRHHHALGMRYEEAKSLRDYALALERDNTPGEAADVFGAAYRLFARCGALAEMEKIANRVDPDIVKAEELAAAPDKKETSLMSGDLNNLRIDTLLEVSSSMTEIDSVQGLLKQALFAMVRATGAQYGYMFIEEHTGIRQRTIALNFKGKRIAVKNVRAVPGIVEEVKDKRAIVHIPDCGADERFDSDDLDYGDVKSILAVPLMRKQDYFGCMYLGNDIAAGLFSENERKAAQILAAQAGVLLENAYLMDQYKQLNNDLQRRVDEQTKDIRQKNEDLRDFNERLINSERMKNLLTGALVHDIKNHAAGIEGNFRILSRRAEDAKTRRNITAVVGSCADIVSLSSNMLDIGKMEEGKLEVRSRIVTVRDVFGIYAKLRQNPVFDEKQIRVSAEASDRHISFEADPYLLDRVLQNLFSNAAKYVPPGGDIRLSVETLDDSAVVCLYTSGTPIPDEHKTSLFGKYSRLDSGRSQYSKGLGLFFCKMVAEAHGGRIWLETDPNGNFFKIAFTRCTDADHPAVAHHNAVSG